MATVTVKSGQFVRLHGHPYDSPSIPGREGNKYIFGRSGRSTNMEVFLACPVGHMSRRHSEAYFRNGAFWIRDCKSLNGTFLNGARLLPGVERELRNEDVVGLGVSHISDEVDVRDREYFIFKFKESKRRAELITLEEEDAENDDVPVEQVCNERYDVISPESPPPPPVRKFPPAPPAPIIRFLTPDQSSNTPQKDDSPNNHQIRTRIKAKSTSGTTGSPHSHPVEEEQKSSAPVATGSNDNRGKSLDKSSTRDKNEGKKLSEKQTNKKDVEKEKPEPAIHNNESPRRDKEREPKKGKKRGFKYIDGEDENEETPPRKKVIDVDTEASKKRNQNQSGSDEGVDEDVDVDVQNSLEEKASVRLRQLVKVGKIGEPVIRKSKFYTLDRKNRQKIADQWKVSRQKTLKRQKRKKGKIDTDSTSDARSTSEEEAETSDNEAPKTKKLKTKESSKGKRKSNGQPQGNQQFRRVTCKDTTWPSESERSKSPVERKKLGRSASPSSPRSRSSPPLSPSPEYLTPNEMDTDDADHRRSEDEEFLDDAYSQAYGSPSPEPSIMVPASPPSSSARAHASTSSGVTIEEIVEGEPRRTTPRKTQMLDTIPDSHNNRWKSKSVGVKSFPSRQQSQEKDETDRRGESSPPTSPKHSEKDVRGKPLTTKEKLALVAERQKQQRQQEELSKPVPDAGRQNAPVRMKVTAKNRNDELAASLMASEKSSVAAASTSSKTADKQDKPAVPIVPRQSTAPRREIPQLPSPATQMNMPVQRITNLMNKPMPKIGQKEQDKKAMPPPPTKTTVPRNLMEKSGVAVAIERQGRPVQELYDYPRSSSSVPIPQAPTPKYQPIYPEDEAHRRILKWRPEWLEEQKKRRTPPPVAKGCPLVRTLTVYEDFKSYVEVFFPLILEELWATVTQDAYNSSKHKSSAISLPITVTQVMATRDCPMLHSNWKPVPYSDPESRYTVLHCSAILSERRQTNEKLDFAKLTLRFHNQKDNKVCDRQVFGYVSWAKNEVQLIDDTTVVPPLLREKSSRGKFLYSFEVVVMLSKMELIVASALGKMEKVSYVNPKLRDIRGLFNLRNSPLFSHIIKPTLPKTMWNPQGRPSPYLVPYVAKLNWSQKLAVEHIVSRLMVKDPELLLLHGPPGTGKTKTIVGLILQILFSPNLSPHEKRILVCTPSNTAIDEIMMRLLEAFASLPSTATGNKQPRMVRIGDSHSSLLKKYSVEALAREVDHKNAMNGGIQKSIQICKQNIQKKETEINKIKAGNGSHTQVYALRREIESDAAKLRQYELDLNARTTDKNPASQQQKRKVLEDAQIICSTLNSCSSTILTNTFGQRSGRKSKPFACCIVDEASQTTEPETLAPLLLNVDKLVLVGDPKQLGATILSQVAASRGLDLSLFTRLHDYYTQTLEKPDSVMMLTEQYRMHQDILSWPNEFFYRGLLKTNVNRNAGDETCPLRPYLFLNLSSKESSNKKGQINNDEEAQVVVEIVHNIHETLRGYNRAWSVGVITPYSSQKNVITAAVKRELGEAVSNCTEVDTVDSFQGREKDIIIISCVRTDDTGFLKNEKRLNVALTRAKHSLIIVGDARCLKRDAMWKSLIDNADERKCLFNIPDWRTSGFLKNKLYQVLSSPQKPSKK